jgi:hypothetical protein
MRPGHALTSVILCLPIILTGCALQQTAAPTPESGIKLKGNVHGGQQPIVGAHVYLFAANTTGYGGLGIAASGANTSLSLLNATSTGLADSIGAYVTTDANGGFTITGDYNCTPNSQVYLYALGGNPGAGVNSAAGLLAALGSCPSSGSFLASLPFIQVNEVTTIAAAYAMAGFATDATHVSSSGTPLAQTGIANAFANATNLADITTGNALAITPAGNGTVPQSTINTLADILASCINSTGPASTPCSTLLSTALANGASGTQPTDTATATINIAHNPALNIATLYALVTPQPPFVPNLATAPYDFSILLVFKGGGLGTAQSIAIDRAGNAWIASQDSPVVELSSSGAFLSGATGFSGGNPWGTLGIAIDLSEDAWITNSYGNDVAKFSSSGSVLSGASGFTSGGITSPGEVAIDASGDAWITGYSFNDQANVVKLSSSGAALSGAYGYSGGGLSFPLAIGIDGSGNAWVANYGGQSVTELSNSGAILSGPNGYTGGGIAIPVSLALDRSGNVWVASHSTYVPSPGGVTKLSNTGATLIAAAGYHTTGMTYPYGIAIDGSGNAWVTSDSPPYTGIFEISSSGATLSSANGYGFGKLGFPEGIAIDGSGDVWVADQGEAVEELIGAATPVITPIAAGLPLTPTADGTSNLGTRP